MSLPVHRNALVTDDPAVRPVSWKNVTHGQPGESSWKIVGLGIGIGLIAILLYYAESRGISLRRFYRYLFLFPIALAAYNFGMSGGLSTALSCTAALFPILVQLTRRFGLWGETLEVLSLIVFFNLFAFIVANLADFQRKQERLHLILDQISGLFEKGLDARQLSAAVLSSGMEICRAEFGEVILQDEVTGELQAVAQQGPFSTDQGPCDTFTTRGACLADWLIANNRALLVNHLDRNPLFERQPGSPPIRSLLAVPLRCGPKAVGFLALMNKQGGLFTSEDLETLTAIAEKSQMAIENARLYEQTDEKLRQRVEEFANLAQLSMALSATLDLDQTLEAAAAHAAQALQVPMCDIRLVKGACLDVGAAVGYQKAAAHGPPIKIEGRLRRMMEKRQPLAVADLESEPALPAEWHRWLLRKGVRAYLGVPLVSQGRSIGVLSVYRKEPQEWLTYDIDFAATIANTVASGIANAQLFETVSEGKRWTELVLRGIADGVMTTNQECRIRTFNPAAEWITGRSADEVVGRYFCEVFGARDECTRLPGDHVCPHRQATTRDASDLQPNKIGFTPAGGAELTLAITTAPLRNQLGEPLGTASIFRDISKEEHLDRMKSDFISIISHELRAPLTNIIVSVDLLRRSQLEPGVEQEVIDILYSQSRSLSRFVEHILSVSRLDAGGIQVQLQPVTVRPLLWRAIDAVQAKGAHHKFEVHVPANLPYVLADESKLEIILHNLLINAMQYSSEGSTVTVEAHEHNGNVEISVSDEGPGIPPEDQKLIFERFYQIDTTDSRRAYGYGLGLYICRRLVEAQGGHIWVESREGVGSRFSFSLQSPKVREGEKS